MCGIFGWSFKAYKQAARRIGVTQREALVTALAIYNNKRGDQSWGYYVANEQGWRLNKDVGTICRAGGIAALAQYPTLMAHTRYSTKGAITKDNAHPFHVGQTVLAHNGVIYNWEELNDLHRRDVPVDSLHLLHHLTENKPFNDVEGYGSIEFVKLDESTSRVYLCRMRQGDLAIFGLRNDRGEKCGVVWSSDETHLEIACEGAGLDWFSYKEEEEGVGLYADHGDLYQGKFEIKLQPRSFDPHISYSEAYAKLATSGGLPPGASMDEFDPDTYIEQTKRLAKLRMTDKMREEYCGAYGITYVGRGRYRTTAGDFLDQEDLDEEIMAAQEYDQMMKEEDEEDREFERVVENSHTVTSIESKAAEAQNKIEKAKGTLKVTRDDAPPVNKAADI